MEPLNCVFTQLELNKSKRIVPNILPLPELVKVTSCHFCKLLRECKIKCVSFVTGNLHTLFYTLILVIYTLTKSFLDICNFFVPYVHKNRISNSYFTKFPICYLLFSCILDTWTIMSIPMSKMHSLSLYFVVLFGHSWVLFLYMSKRYLCFGAEGLFSSFRGWTVTILEIIEENHIDFSGAFCYYEIIL